MLRGRVWVAYKYQMYMDRSGRWRWRFIAPNNRKMAESTGGYKTEEGCLSAIETIKERSMVSRTTKIVPS